MGVQTQNVFDISQWRKSVATEMDAFQFQQWTDLLANRTGISLSETRRSFLLTSLNTRMHELAIDSYQAYYNFLLSGRKGDIEWETLVDRLTVHETRFFRDEHALNLIRDVYLGQLNTSSKKNITVWSVGCATGEESYSLAIELDDYLKNNDKEYYYAVTGSDISSAAIMAARKGVYKNNRLSNIPDNVMSEYVDEHDETSFKVKDFLRQRVCFNQINLLELKNIKVGLMDIIVCQNVLIYFKREQRLQILNGLVAHLKQGGLLILGPGEIHGWGHPEMKSVAYDSTLAFCRTKNQESRA